MSDFLEELWDIGRNPYDPGDPWTNAGMIFIIPFAAIAVGLVLLVLFL